MVLLKKVINANPGTADLVGGNDWDKLSDYFNDTNVSETPRINNPTEFRSGILSIRDASNAFNVTIKSATQTANRDYTIPALIGNDTPATLALSNVFTALQQIQLDADTLLSLYRPVSTTNSLCAIGFNARNSSNVQTNYASIASKLIVNTAGIEDGKLVFYVRKAGVLTEVMSVDKNGLLTVASVSSGGGGGVSLSAANTWTDVQTISKNAAVLANLYRPASTANNLVGLDFQHMNASSAQTSYGNISTKLITNTAGDEDGTLIFSVKKDGVMTQVGSLDKNGLLTVNSISALPTNTVTVLLNSGATTTISNTSTETDMLNYTLPGNTLGANGSLKVRLGGYFLMTDGTNRAYNIRIKFGGTTIFDGNTTTFAAQTENRPFVMEFVLRNANSTSSQTGGGRFITMLGDVVPNAGIGDIQDDETQVNSAFGFGASSANTTTNQALVITMTHAITSTNQQTVVQGKEILFVPGA